MSAARTEGSNSGTRPQPGSDDETDVQAPPALSRDEIFDTLKASRRRDVLRYLDENGGTATTGTLAEHVAAIENDVDRGAISSSQRKRVYVALYQAHLPRMADFGIIEYDSDRGHVQLCDRAEKVLSYLYYDPDAPEGGSEEAPDLLARVTGFLRRLRR